MKSNINFHGSDIERVAKHFGLKEEDICNFSGNVNPMGLSEQLRHKLIENIHLVTSYPDPDYVKLKHNIAEYVDSKEEYVLLGNGSTELIAHYIDYVNPKKVLIVGPTYSEYEKKSRTLNAEVHYCPLKMESDFTHDIAEIIHDCHEDIDLLVLCNPNNPTASCISSEGLLPVFDHCKAFGTHILIDETYMDFVDDAHSVSAVSLMDAYDNCIVLGVFQSFSQPRVFVLATVSRVI